MGGNLNFDTLEELLDEIRRVKLKEDWKYTPSQPDLKNAGYGYIYAGARFYGGLPFIRKTLGEKRLKRGRKFVYVNKKALIAELKMLKKACDWERLPLEDELSLLGLGDLRLKIKRCGGYGSIRPLIGERNMHWDRKWANESYAIGRALSLMERHNLSVCPSTSFLRDNDSAMGWAAYTYHGGMKNFSKLVNDAYTLKLRPE